MTTFVGESSYLCYLLTISLMFFVNCGYVFDSTPSSLQIESSLTS